MAKNDTSKEASMVSPSLLSDDTLKKLASELPANDVLTAICVVNPASASNQNGALHVRLKNQLTQVGAPSALIEAVLADLGAAQQITRTRAYYLWDEHGHTRSHVIDVQLELPEAIHYGPPDFEPLRYALESSPPSVIVLVDHQWARLFEVRLGEIHELHSPEGGRRNHEHNTDDSHYQEHQTQVFWNALVERLTHLRQSNSFAHLLLAGSFEVCASLTTQLTADLTGRLAGTFSVQGAASAASVLEAARATLESAEHNADETLLEAIRERGVRGPEATLIAVQEGRIYELLVVGDGSSLPVWRDDQGYVFAVYPAQGISPVTNWATQDKRLRDVLGDLRERFGLQVRFLHGDLGSQLETEMGGLAGLPRY